MDFQREAESAGLRPILGAHLVWENEEAVVLAEDDAGWGKICRVISEYHWRSVGPVGPAGPSMARPLHPTYPTI